MTLIERIIPCFSIRFALSLLLAAGLLQTSLSGWSQLVSGSMDVRWNEGASNCANDPQPPLQG